MKADVIVIGAGANPKLEAVAIKMIEMFSETDLTMKEALAVTTLVQSFIEEETGYTYYKGGEVRVKDGQNGQKVSAPD